MIQFQKRCPACSEFVSCRLGSRPDHLCYNCPTHGEFELDKHLSNWFLGINRQNERFMLARLIQQLRAGKSDEVIYPEICVFPVLLTVP
ncbi:hypothetical protein [Enterobacter hormaechei]|uniref:hypothetical protein n=1 Tax=Enterobacter hormaechei TaxID=158836 RepID=UPI002A74FD91|nr:hypothetical protein [Enterobacter hormaechei]MDY3570238.1 hypothetical protein [Enterobacter hormaechei]